MYPAAFTLAVATVSLFWSANANPTRPHRARASISVCTGCTYTCPSSDTAGEVLFYHGSPPISRPKENYSNYLGKVHRPYRDRKKGESTYLECAFRGTPNTYCYYSTCDGSLGSSGTYAHANCPASLSCPKAMIRAEALRRVPLRAEFDPDDDIEDEHQPW